MDFVKKYAYVFLGVVCVLVLGGLYTVGRTRPGGVVDTGQPIISPVYTAAYEPIVYEPANIEPVPPEEPAMITVHIVGAVYSPGVYAVPYGSRVNDVLQLAGGYTQEADVSLINLAAFVQDAMQIRIPLIGEEPQVIESPQTPATATTSADNGLININLATLSELQTLPGIGPVIAQNIIDFREANDGFNSIDELLNVSRIGDGIFGRIRDMVTVE